MIIVMALAWSVTINDKIVKTLPSGTNNLKWKRKLILLSITLCPPLLITVVRKLFLATLLRAESLNSDLFSCKYNVCTYIGYQITFIAISGSDSDNLLYWIHWVVWFSFSVLANKAGSSSSASVNTSSSLTSQQNSKTTAAVKQPQTGIQDLLYNSYPRSDC